MKPLIITAPDRDGRDARVLQATKVEMTLNKGEDHSKNWVQNAHKGIYGSCADDGRVRGDVDSPAAPQAQQVSLTRTVLTPRAGTVRVAHPKDAA